MRYVWSRFNANTDIIADTANQTDELSNGFIDIDLPAYLKQGRDYFLIKTGACSVRNGKVVINNPRVEADSRDNTGSDTDDSTLDETIMTAGNTEETLEFFMEMYKSGVLAATSPVHVLIGDRNREDDAYINIADANTNSPLAEISPIRPIFGDYHLYLATYEIIKGTAAGTVSNTSSGAYPADGISGSYWYELQGSDNPDASAVTYSNNAPMGGQPINIIVTPRANTYGGTIRYTYQVRLSGGGWRTISSNNTATQLSYTIPAGTTTFAARVLTSDTWGYSSTTYTTGSTLTVTNNLPPTAPASITIGSVLAGENCTITWEAATDSDGTIAAYQLERNVDGGTAWTQIYNGPNLTYDDTISADWATVNYRVRAVDDDGEAGPYTTGTAQIVNTGWLYFSGPPADMGEQPAPFDFVFSIGSTSGTETGVTVTVLYDDYQIYSGTPDSGEEITLHIDTRETYAGEHVLVIEGEKTGLLGFTQECTFTVPALTIPDGGHAVQFYNSEGDPVFPITLARQVIGLQGLDVNALFDRYFSGTYTGTGTSGAGNPCQLRLSFVPRFLFVYSPSGNAWGFWIRTAEPTTEAQGTMATNGGSCTVQWDNDNLILSWYGSSAGVQLNTSGTVYGFVVTG